MRGCPSFPCHGGTIEGIRVQHASELYEGDMSLRVLVVDDHPAFRKARVVTHAL